MKRALPVIRPTSVHQCHALGIGAPRELTDGAHGQPCPFVGCADHLAWAAIGVQTPTALSKEELLHALSRIETIELDGLSATCGRQLHTLESIGAVWDLTRERARQIEAKALKKLRHPERSRRLAEHKPQGAGVSRPDLRDKPVSFPKVADLQKAAARFDAEYARIAADLSRRNGGSLKFTAPRATPSTDAGRVLVGAERARRIAELKARKDGAR